MNNWKWFTVCHCQSPGRFLAINCLNGVKVASYMVRCAVVWIPDSIDRQRRSICPSVEQKMILGFILLGREALLIVTIVVGECGVAFLITDLTDYNGGRLNHIGRCDSFELRVTIYASLIGSQEAKQWSKVDVVYTCCLSDDEGIIGFIESVECNQGELPVAHNNTSFPKLFWHCCEFHTIVIWEIILTKIS